MLSFAEVCEELDRRRQVTLGFERIEALLNLLGNPERGMRFVQVVGTNGKGTTAVALAAALEELGYAAGAYLSPHVLSYTERMMLRGDVISEDEFSTVMREVMKTADEHRVPASQFELLTAGSLKLFRDAGLSVAVLEAGLGARHDATSVAPAEAVVLTNVGLDHVEYLGGSIQRIAREKLASLRPGSTLILGTEAPEVLEIARETAAGVGARLVRASSADQETLTSGKVAPFVEHDIRLGVETAELVTGRSLDDVSRERVAHGVVGALPARFEVHEARGVPVVVDGGHNVSGLRASLGAMRVVLGRRPLGVVFGALRDKDVVSMLAVLGREADLVVLTRPRNERAADPEWISRELDPRDRGERRALVITCADDALEEAVEQMKKADGVVLVTGSLYTGAAVLGALRADQ